MKLKTCLIALWICSQQVPVYAQFGQQMPVMSNNQQALNDIQALANGANNMDSVRGGGSSGRALGAYNLSQSVQFSSDYKGIDKTTMAQFALALSAFVKAKGGGWVVGTGNSASSFVPYETQKEWAETWWRSNSPTYRNVPFMSKDAFLYEAILDGTNLYNYYLRYYTRAGSADFAIWCTASVDELSKKR